MNYMRRFLSILKYTGLTLAAILLLVFVGGFLFTSLSPQFGGSPTEAQVASYEKSGHFEEGLFVNNTPTSMEMDWATIKTLLRDYLVGVPNLAPENLLPVLKVDSLSIVNRPDTLTRLTWFGHSAFLLEIEGKNILLDPMFGDSPSPISWLGSHRFTEGLPIEIEQLPAIDAVFFSHDHYDHLDYESVMRLKGKVKDFYVPLGVGAHLAAWGVAEDKIHEMNWWEETTHENLQIVCTPARHFSGRGITNRFSTLWSSWVIKGQHANIYFSGDSGYGPHFKEIGQKYGPFDAALMECGQYDLRWHNIHMLPEETAQGAIDLNAKVVMPIHWGAFVLALHAWKDPIDRVTKEAAALGMPIATPKIGERLMVGQPDFPMERWWDSLK
ncbi:MAG: MBL fold metallo-hydrolase [Imperialibacter sp.]|uniref:MBL fold metallo-hydrolase n=1 Tax=Imperialibacter sp. TaxID=2038411 RepID=UPI003A86FD5A